MVRGVQGGGASPRREFQAPVGVEQRGSGGRVVLAVALVEMLVRVERSEGRGVLVVVQSVVEDCLYHGA